MEYNEYTAKGFISLYRSVQKHWIFSDADYFKAWIQILFNVNFKEGKTLIKGELLHCDKGQSLMSIKSWTEVFGSNWTEKRVRHFFELLEKDKMIKLEGLKYTTKLTVINYELYQKK